MLKRIGTLSVFMVLFLHALAFAHGTGKHLMGVVTALDAQHVVVKAKDGHTFSILLNTETKYRRGKTAAPGADLNVGDRVVVDVIGKGDKMTATQIHFASSGKGKSHEGMPHQTKP